MADAYVRLVRAAKSGKGVRLTHIDVVDLVYGDDAIYTAAENCESECTCDIQRTRGATCTFCENQKGGSDV